MSPVLEIRCPVRRVKGRKCWTLDWLGHRCDRREGHGGRHAAHGAEWVIHVWSDADSAGRW